MLANLKHANGQLALALALLEGDNDMRHKVEAAKAQLSGHLFESDLPDELKPALAHIVVAEVGNLDPSQVLGLAQEITSLAWVVFQKVEQKERNEFWQRTFEA